MLISFIRAIILYMLLVLGIRLTGKRQLGQMEPTEFVLALLIADLAAVPMQDQEISLLSGVIPIIVVLSIELLVSILTYHNVGLRRFFCGKPVILMAHGKLLQQNMKKTRVNADELTEHLRLQGVTALEEVQYAILETNGSISLLLYPEHRPATAEEAGIKTQPLHLPITLISNGQLLRSNLKLAQRTEAWVHQTLQHYNCTVRDVFLFTIDSSGKIYLSVNEEENL